MTITNCQRIQCDRCEAAKLVLEDERFSALQFWIMLSASDVIGSGLSGGGLRSHTVLCDQCRRDFTVWLEHAPSP